MAFWAELDAGSMSAIAQHTLTRWPGGMALDVTGHVLWITGVEQTGGLWRGEWAGLGQPVWSVIAPDHPARCVMWPAAEPLLCASRMSQGHDISALGADGRWTPRISFTELLGPHRGCPADSQVRQVCPAVWDELAVALRVAPDREPPEQDAPDMGAPIDYMIGEDGSPDQSGSNSSNSGERGEGSCSFTAPGGPGAVGSMRAL